MKFRNKPAVIEATQWFKNGDHPKDFDKDVVAFKDGQLRRWSGAEAKANGWEGTIVRRYRLPWGRGNSL